MSAYRLRATTIVGPAAIETLVCPIDADHIGRGTDAMVRTFVDDLGLDAGVRAWTLDPVRTPYVAPLAPDPHEWRDRWSAAWRLHVELDRVPSAWEAPASGVPSNAVDDSWERALHHLDWPSARALVYADFRDADARARAIARFSGEALVLDTRREVLGFPQLIADLGVRDRAWFEAGAPEGERAIAACAAEGASLHFDETFRRHGAARSMHR